MFPLYITDIESNQLSLKKYRKFIYTVCIQGSQYFTSYIQVSPINMYTYFCFVFYKKVNFLLNKRYQDFIISIGTLYTPNGYYYVLLITNL